VEGGLAAAKELLALSPRPSAFFAANDLMAMGALMHIRTLGLRVPEDIAIVGFDDIPAAAIVHPPLTTIAQYPELLGSRAAELVIERLDSNSGLPGRREETPFDLVIRESA
ncbi:MAG: substrate-binding domain-containing protein, partial [Chloroflexota bacterium]